jgi:pyruvate dehydrogenase E1 component alpha subunit
MEIPSKEVLLKLYRDLVTARRLDTRIAESASGMLHRGPGEEAIPIAICNNLTRTDCFHPNFRNDICVFAKPGFTVADVVASKSGKVVEHNTWATPEYGMLGSGGTLGEPALKYLGAALEASINKTDDVTVYVQGDGAANRAPNHEAMVVAAAWKLPIIFVIQNNRYAIGTPVEASYAIDDLSLRGVGYGFPHDRVDGNDMLAMYQVAKKHIDRTRNGGGPSLIAADTYRLMAHYNHDEQIYRPKGQVEEWWKKDPLPRYTKQLMDIGVLNEGDINRLEEEIAAEIEAAFEAASALPISRNYEKVKMTAVAEL